MYDDIIQEKVETLYDQEQLAFAKMKEDQQKCKRRRRRRRALMWVLRRL